MIDPAISGIGGVLVGGVLTGAIDQFRGWRQRRRDLRTAARLASSDAHTCALALQESLETGDWWPDLEEPSTETWDAYRRDLIAELSPDDADTVQGAFVQVKRLQRARQDKALFSDWKESVEKATEAMGEAGGTLLLVVGRSKRQMKKLSRDYESRPEADGA